MKNDLPLPLIIAIVVVVLIGIVFFAYQQSTPRRPANARPAAEGIRASLSKELGRPVGPSPKARSGD